MLLGLFPSFHSYADRVDIDKKEIAAYSVQRGPKLKTPFCSSMLSKFKYCLFLASVWVHKYILIE